MPKLSLMPKRSVDAERRYEAAKKRPGEFIGLRVPKDMLKAIDAARGQQARGTWIKQLLARALGFDDEED